MMLSYHNVMLTSQSSQSPVFRSRNRTLSETGAGGAPGPCEWSPRSIRCSDSLPPSSCLRTGRTGPRWAWRLEGGRLRRKCSWHWPESSATSGIWRRTPSQENKSETQTEVQITRDVNKYQHVRIGHLFGHQARDFAMIGSFKIEYYGQSHLRW